MRNLQADLDLIKPEHIDRLLVDTEVIVEWLNRAILAEDAMERMQQACGEWMNKAINAEAEVERLDKENAQIKYDFNKLNEKYDKLNSLIESHAPEGHNVTLKLAWTCEGCQHKGAYENEVEYGYPSPCTCCKRRCVDRYLEQAEKEGE